MSAFGCCTNPFKALSRAAAKAASARLRLLGLRAVAPDWSQRAAVCETCPMRVVVRGTSYCGRPFLDQLSRDPSVDGCGCPTRDKAKDPDEHCPLSPANHPAQSVNAGCDCKWCALAATV